MLPSRGLARNPASALRYSLSTSSRTKPTRTLSTRQFSQAQPHSPVLPRYGLSRTTACHSGRVMPSVSPVGYGAPAAMAAGVFAQRSGAARNLSLWPFQSKSQNTQTAETLADPLPEPPVAAQSPVAEAPTVSVSSAPAEPASNAADLSQLPEDLLREFDSQSLLDIPERIGYLKELGLDYAIGPTASCQWLVEHIHVYSGMPWWGTLASAAILFRVAMFYPTLDGAKHQARLQKVQSDPAYVKAKAEFEEAAFRTKDRASMMYARSDMRRLVKESGVSMWKPFIGFATVPFSFGMFRLIRAMTNVPVPGMETGGLAWFTDLTVADPFYILPMVSVGLGSLMVIKTQSANMLPPNPTQAAMMKGMKYFLPPLMFLGTAWLPAGLQWFFVFVSVGSLVQAQATVSPAIRRWAGLPPLHNSPRPAATGRAASIQYQSPTDRTIKGTFQQGLKAAAKTVQEATGATEQKARWKKAQAYEDKRAEEEKRRDAQRIEELRRRRAERRH